MRRAIAVAVGAMVLGAAPVDAQVPEALSKGTTSLAFTLPQSGSSAAGIWRFLTDRDALGLTVSVQVNREHVSAGLIDRTATNWGIGMGPAYKRYFTPKGRVAPFVNAAAVASWNGDDLPDVPDANRWGLNATAGLGADWFPVEEISLGGFVGIRGSYGTMDGPSGIEHSSWALRTLTSAISAHVYF